MISDNIERFSCQIGEIGEEEARVSLVLQNGDEPQLMIACISVVI